MNFSIRILGVLALSAILTGGAGAACTCLLYTSDAADEGLGLRHALDRQLQCNCNDRPQRHCPAGHGYAWDYHYAGDYYTCNQLARHIGRHCPSSDGLRQIG